MDAGGYQIISKYTPGKGHSIHLHPPELPKRLDLMLSMMSMSMFITIKEAVRCQLFEEFAQKLKEKGIEFDWSKDDNAPPPDEKANPVSASPQIITNPNG